MALPLSYRYGGLCMGVRWISAWIVIWTMFCEAYLLPEPFSDLLSKLESLTLECLLCIWDDWMNHLPIALNKPRVNVVCSSVSSSMILYIVFWKIRAFVEECCRLWGCYKPVCATFLVLWVLSRLVTISNGMLPFSSTQEI